MGRFSMPAEKLQTPMDVGDEMTMSVDRSGNWKCSGMDSAEPTAVIKWLLLAANESEARMRRLQHWAEYIAENPLRRRK